LYGGPQIAVFAFFYWLIYPSIASLIPVNAALHATSALLLFKTFEKSGFNERRATLGILPFCLFPTSLLWVTQIHKDGLFILGLFLLFYGLAGLFSKFPELTGRKILIAIVYIVVALLPIGLSRPLLIQVLGLAVCASLLPLFFCLFFMNGMKNHRAIAVCFLGVLVGDTVLFFLGRRLGKRFFNLPGVRFVFSPERVKFAEDKLKRNARKVCFTARFLAGLRAPIFFTAGMLGVKPRDFLLLDGTAALLSVPAITYLGYYFGDEIDIALHYMRRAERYFLVVFAVIGFIFVVNINLILLFMLSGFGVYLFVIYLLN
jgi:membrane protein DedA with SNARE-associated domain